jgi:hypothetical protein
MALTPEQRLAREAIFTRAELAILRIIKKRTREGKDVRGASFRPYSAGYRRVRQRANRPTSPVDLIFSNAGGMLDSIEGFINQDLTKLSIEFNKPDKERLAYYHNISGAGKGKVIREFWGLSEEESEKVFKDVEQLALELGSNITEKELENVLKKLQGNKNVKIKLT